MPSYNGINFTDDGDGDTPLVLIHGFCCDHTDWDGLREHLGAGYRTVALDLRGHGASAKGEGSIEEFADDVADLVESESLDRAILVGHSMGCRVVLEANRRLSAHVRGLVLVDGSRAVTSTDALPGMREAVADMGFAAFAGSLFAQMFTDKTDPAVAKTIVDRACAHDPHWAMNLWNSMATWDATRFEAALESAWAPVLAIQTTFLNSDRQRVSMSDGESTEYTAFLSSQFQNDASTIEVIPDTGHFPQLEEPARLAELLRSFTQA